ncbi:MAG: NADH-quinone oxidoreductase subunit L [Blastocatellia bacterium]
MKILTLLVFAPLIGSIINGLAGKKLGEKFVAVNACFWVGVSAVLSWVAFLTTLPAQADPDGVRRYTEHFFTWLQVGAFRADFAYLLDPLSTIYILFITNVAFLIHVYATGYMHGDPGYYRFFSYLNLFMFMMLNLVLGDNLLLLFVGWEGVGLCSYLLIGYYIRKQEAGDAAKKAFVTNRIGDFGYMIGMFLIFATFGTISFVDKADGTGTVVKSFLTQAATMPIEAFGVFGVLTVIGLLLFVGATGKSAQIPLFVWLPDAMAGPTPVSALIHAATMVTAGVYMAVRCSQIFAHSRTAMFVVALIGALTALFAATIGLAQNDIKKVLAYSTVSQLGYMFLAVGVGAYVAAIFHVMTHAFFKALLFLGSGSVIHGMHEEQDIRRMGGLKKYMKITWATMMMGWLAICGIPIFSGFFSKDEILWKTFSTEALPGSWGRIFWFIAALTALTTAIYMTRMMVMTFWGTERFRDAHAHDHGGHGDHGHHHGDPHESPASMWIPLAVLAVLSVVGGLIGIPHAMGGSNQFEHFLEPVVAHVSPIGGHVENRIAPGLPTSIPAKAADHAPAAAKAEEHHDTSTELGLAGLSVLIALAGIGLGFALWGKNPLKSMPKLLENKYYVDEVYNGALINPIHQVSKWVLWKFVDVIIIDGIVNGVAGLTSGIGSWLRTSQTGFARAYAAFILLGAVVLISFFAFR